MKTLSETWFADGYIDFELKKYTLLAYLQEIHRYFNENKLYPQLADIIFHYNNLAAFRENKKYLQEQFPKKLTGVQIEKLQILYEQMIGDDELIDLGAVADGLADLLGGIVDDLLEFFHQFIVIDHLFIEDL